jgi:hypothetical protein
MNIKDQVCNSKLAIRLKELGVKQDSLYWWDINEESLYRSVDRSAKDLGCYSAFTVAELGELLKPIVGSEKGRYDMPEYNDSRNKYIWFCGGEAGSEDTEADARAQLLICSIEHNLRETK